MQLSQINVVTTENGSKREKMLQKAKITAAKYAANLLHRTEVLHTSRGSQPPNHMRPDCQNMSRRKGVLQFISFSNSLLEQQYILCNFQIFY